MNHVLIFVTPNFHNPCLVTFAFLHFNGTRAVLTYKREDIIDRSLIDLFLIRITYEISRWNFKTRIAK